jgi:dihydrodipicolinate synthase/N-acetylneuraminate lyase
LVFLELNVPISKLKEVTSFLENKHIEYKEITSYIEEFAKEETKCLLENGCYPDVETLSEKEVERVIQKIAESVNNDDYLMSKLYESITEYLDSAIKEEIV